MKILVLYAHPAQQHSRVNAALADVAKGTQDVSFVDLYAQYPRLDLDADVEQQRLLDHDAIIFQFPMMWYSTPPILKEWQDLVLEYGFAYGEGGDKLAGKLWLTCVSMGSSQESYSPAGHNIFSVRQLLAPLEATARLCQMKFIAPFTMFESLKSSEQGSLEDHATAYGDLLMALKLNRLNISAAADQDIIGTHNMHSLISEQST